MCIYRLTLAWISSEKFYNPWGVLTHLDWSSLTAAGPCLMPPGLFAVWSRLATHVTLRQLLSVGPFVQLLLAFPCLLPGCVEMSSPNPLSGFAPKQTKGSSAWRTTYIVLQSDTERNIVPWLQNLLLSGRAVQHFSYDSTLSYLINLRY